MYAEEGPCDCQEGPEEASQSGSPARPEFRSRQSEHQGEDHSRGRKSRGKGLTARTSMACLWHDEDLSRGTTRECEGRGGRRDGLGL